MQCIFTGPKSSEGNENILDVFTGSLLRGVLCLKYGYSICSALVQ